MIFEIIAIDDEQIARVSRFCWSAEIYFQRLAGPRNVCVYLNYDFYACECLCSIYPLEPGEVMT